VAFWSRLRRDNALRDQSKLLVGGANVTAITFYLSAAEDHPCLKDVNPSDWDLFMTTAMVFVAVAMLGAKQLGDVQDELYGAISADLDQWHAESTAASKDSGTFCNKAFKCTAQRWWRRPLA
jgi:hypothetical protein